LPLRYNSKVVKVFLQLFVLLQGSLRPGFRAHRRWSVLLVHPYASLSGCRDYQSSFAPPKCHPAQYFAHFGHPAMVIRPILTGAYTAMAEQLGLSRQQFDDLVDCRLDGEGLAALYEESGIP